MKTDKKPTTRSNKGLQKLTESDEKINSILALERISMQDLDRLDEPERIKLYQIITDTFNELNGSERDDFYRKIEAVTASETKNQIWENNHNSIIYGIATLTHEYGRMPTKSEIANKNQAQQADCT